MPADQVAPDRVPVGTLWDIGDAWLRRSAEVIGQSEEALDALNVFPVSDADTGSNLRLTLTGVAESVERFERATLDQVVQAAVLSAHGNSGAIVAEMFISVCRAIARNPITLARTAPGHMVAELLDTVAVAATQAVAEPVSGTILTVADDAARAARTAAEQSPANALAVARAAQQGAHAALARTPDQLAVLEEAGVVDAGGQALVLMLDVLVEVLGGPVAVPLIPATARRPGGGPGHPHGPADSPSAYSSPAQHAVPGVDPGPDGHEVGHLDEYEVMYVVSGASPEALGALRRELSELGTSVVVVGDTTTAQIHVHVHDAGRAVEAGLGVGRLSRISIHRLRTVASTRTASSVAPLPADRADGSATRTEGAAGSRSVLFVAAGPGIADAVRGLGGVPVELGPGAAGWQELAEAARQGSGDLVILPNDMERLELAGHLAADLRAEGRRVAVIPTVAQVQGLAALAVHEPTGDFDAVVVAMSSTAGHARHGAVTVAESPAMTMAGRCSAGDVLGVVEGDFVEIGRSAAEVGARVIDRLLATGGELLTLVVGRDADPALVDELARHARRGHAELDVEVLDGGQLRYPVLLGVE